MAERRAGGRRSSGWCFSQLRVGLLRKYFLGGRATYLGKYGGMLEGAGRETCRAHFLRCKCTPGRTRSAICAICHYSLRKTLYNRDPLQIGKLFY